MASHERVEIFEAFHKYFRVQQKSCENFFFFCINYLARNGINSILKTEILNKKVFTVKWFLGNKDVYGKPPSGNGIRRQYLLNFCIDL